MNLGCLYVEEELIKLLDRYVVRDSDLALAEAIKLYWPRTSAGDAIPSAFKTVYALT